MLVVRCNLCGAEMRLMRVEQDHGMKASGYEHRTFECGGRQKRERRLAFAGDCTSWPAAYRWALEVIAQHHRRSGLNARIPIWGLRNGAYRLILPLGARRQEWFSPLRQARLARPRPSRPALEVAFLRALFRGFRQRP